MQEEVDSRTVALVITSAKLTGRVMMSAISRLLAYHNAKKQQDSLDKVCPASLKIGIQ